MLLRKHFILPLAALFSLTTTTAMSAETEKKVKIIEYKTDVELVSEDGEQPFKFVFDGKPSEQEIEAAIADLSPEKQEKIRNILNNLDIDANVEGAKVFAFKSAGGDIEKEIEVHAEHFYSTDDAAKVIMVKGDKEHANVFKFAFSDDEKGGHFQAIKHLLKSAALTPEQVFELQDLLSQE